jgi:hypothetical protein
MSALTLEQRQRERNSLPPKIRALVPCPYEDDLYAAAGQMAKAIAFGWMRGREAYAALALKMHTLPVDNAEAALAKAWQTLRAHVEWRRKTRDHVQERISQTLKPLLEQHAPRNRLLSEAHGVNGATHFFYTEEEVSDLVALEVWHSLPQAPRSRRRGP